VEDSNLYSYILPFYFCDHIKEDKMTGLCSTLAGEWKYVQNNSRASSRNDQQYAQICTTALFYIPAPTCFGSSLPTSDSFWIRLSYMKIQIDLVVCHIMLVKWPVCRSVVVPSVVLPS
jgi:hypothetical protein